MGHIAYWILFSFFLIILIFLITSKKINISDYIIILTQISISKMLDHMLGIAHGFYYYVQPGLIRYYYALFYDIVVYSTGIILFKKLMPKNKTIKNLLIYNLICIAFVTLFELFVIRPLGIIVYVKWRIIPQSLIFYIFFLPAFTWYILLIEKKVYKYK